MPNEGLLFIPDISGFTRFVSETDIEHSRLIIQELLELLINSDQLGLVVSEVEGDAILFYRFGAAPPPEAIYLQVAKMFCEFHQALIIYDQRRFCQCKACTSARGLTLKIITHYGEFTDYTVKNFNKLIGKDVIVAHQLLKNDINQHEYWLVTEKLVANNRPVDFTNWMEWKSSSKQTESGEIAFHYTQLGALRNNIKPAAPKPPDLSGKIKVASATREYNTDMITLFHAAGDFNFRSQWQEGVLEVEELNHFLPRVGMRSRFTTAGGETIMHASSFSFDPARLSFSETDETTGNLSFYYLEKTGDDKMKLTIDCYHEKAGTNLLLFNLFKKKKLTTMLNRSLQNLEKVVAGIKLPPVLD